MTRHQARHRLLFICVSVPRCIMCTHTCHLQYQARHRSQQPYYLIRIYYDVWACALIQLYLVFILCLYCLCWDKKILKPLWSHLLDAHLILAILTVLHALIDHLNVICFGCKNIFSVQKVSFFMVTIGITILINFL